MLARIFRRTPSLRTRVAFATAIGAAIVVTIVVLVVTASREHLMSPRHRLLTQLDLLTHTHITCALVT